MTATMSFNGFTTNRAGQIDRHFSQRVLDAMESLSPEQLDTIGAMANKMSINLILDNTNGSVKVYTSRPGAGVAMIQEKKVWWLSAQGKATIIAYKW